MAPKYITRNYLKGKCHEIFDFTFSTSINFPQAPDNTIRAVSNFRKFAEIFAAQGAPPVSLTPVANGKNLQSEEFSLFFLTFFGGKFAAGVIDTGGNMPVVANLLPVSLTPVAYLPPVSTTPAEL
jgi:hypothetical protein